MAQSPFRSTTVRTSEEDLSDDHSDGDIENISQRTLYNIDNISVGSLKPNIKSSDDKLSPELFYTHEINQGVKLRMSIIGHGSESSYTVPKLLSKTVHLLGDCKALGIERDGTWKFWSWIEYRDEIIEVAKSLIQIGVRPYSVTGILSFNCPEWFIAFLGTIHASAVACGYYTTSSPQTIQYIATDSKTVVLFVDSNAQMEKIRKIRPMLKLLKAIVKLNNEAESMDGVDVYTWDDFKMLGASVTSDEFEGRLAHIKVNKCCSLIYTSGTTGTPKGVMLSHDNLTWTAMKSADFLGIFDFGMEKSISYLPLSHVAGLFADIILPLCIGTFTFFARPDALKGTLDQTIKQVRPTMLFGVPRVFEKISEKMISLEKDFSRLKLKLLKWARKVGHQTTKDQQENQRPSWKYYLAKYLVYRKVKKAMGCEKCKCFASAGAPFMKHTLEFFSDIDIPIYEIYGMSETSGPQTMSQKHHFRIGSVGIELPGVKTKLVNMDRDGNGEICMYGRNACMGYLNLVSETEKLFNKDGFVVSGDIGRWDKDRFLYITGRMKEMIITAGGENIAPVPIEEAIKAALPCVSFCMVVGDKRKFLSVLITIRTEINLKTMEPSDCLAAETRHVCRELNVQCMTLSDLLSSNYPAFDEYIQQGIDEANKKAISNAAKVNKWRILPRDFSVAGGELGPSFKVRRPVVLRMYEDLISSIYITAISPGVIGN